VPLLLKLLAALEDGCIEGEIAASGQEWPGSLAWSRRSAQAIELAAAWLRVPGVEQILERLDGRPGGADGRLVKVGSSGATGSLPG